MKTKQKNKIGLYFVLFLLLLFCGWGYVKADYRQDDNNGFFYVDFLNNQTGIVSEASDLRDNIDVDTVSGSAKLLDSSSAGYFTTVPIQPA
ncbi:MAG: hypothetical protein GF347_03295 [Candidatus Moranbacteria bacterium]|nr:hypothetical protein [Candidatus Moranbacteria bacterium]